MQRELRQASNIQFCLLPGAKVKRILSNHCAVCAQDIDYLVSRFDNNLTAMYTQRYSFTGWGQRYPYRTVLVALRMRLSPKSYR